MAAGVTPGIREASPTVSGFLREHCSIASCEAGDADVGEALRDWPRLERLQEFEPFALAPDVTLVAHAGFENAPFFAIEVGKHEGLHGLQAIYT